MVNYAKAQSYQGKPNQAVAPFSPPLVSGGPDLDPSVTRPPAATGIRPEAYVGADVVSSSGSPTVPVPPGKGRMGQPGILRPRPYIF